MIFEKQRRQRPGKDLFRPKLKLLDEVGEVMRFEHCSVGLKGWRVSPKKFSDGLKDLRAWDEGISGGFKDFNPSQRNFSDGFKCLNPSRRQNSGGFRDFRPWHGIPCQGFK